MWKRGEKADSAWKFRYFAVSTSPPHFLYADDEVSKATRVRARETPARSPPRA